MHDGASGCVEMCIVEYTVEKPVLNDTGWGIVSCHVSGRHISRACLESSFTRQSFAVPERQIWNQGNVRCCKAHMSRKQRSSG
jgi:hypothetical protein